ncbi:MAG: competence/damage-inducible protein A [Flavobacteriales bacterium]|nr:competence/damage-inducible protein A [Flavobacteriales bacterium]
MQAEIITIGDELLIGQTIDTNSAWMGEQLNAIGMHVHQITSITDNPNHIKTALDEALKRSNLILMTGGLGPTKDDVTKVTLTEYFDTKLVLNEEVLAGIEAYFSGRGIPIMEVNKLQAMLPEKCTVLRNLLGTASGMWFEVNGKVVVSMPGVPYEMKGLMSNEVLPRASKHFKTPFIYHRTLLTFGRGESRIAEQIADLEDEMAKQGIKLAYLPAAGRVKLRLSASGTDQIEVMANVDAFFDRLAERLSDIVFGEGKTEMEVALNDVLQAKSKTIACAESCTGGSIAALLAKHPGSSKSFLGGVVAYANEVKTAVLGVKASTLADQGAVSEQTSKEMVLGVIKLTGADYAVSTSGVAGPDGGSEEKPVGTVWIAYGSAEKVFTKQLNLGTNRQRIITVAGLSALNMLRRAILEGKV